MGLELNTSAYKRKKKIPWDKLRHLLAKNIHQGLCNMQTNHHTRGAQWGDGRYRSGGWGEGTYQRMEGVSPFKVGRGRSLGGWSLPLT